jgi:hypothetical protein
MASPIGESPPPDARATVLRIVVVVGHDRLRRAIEDLLVRRTHGRVQVVGRFSRRQGLARALGRLAPDVVVASVRTLGREHAAVSLDLARVSPGSKLILIHPVPVVPRSAQRGTAHLPEDDLVRRLRPTLERLTSGPDERSPRAAVLGADSW